MSMDKEAIRKALDEATPGPWHLNDMDTAYSNEVYVTNKSSWDYFTLASGLTISDAHLISNAPIWLRELLAENDRQAAELADEKRQHEFEQNSHDITRGEIESLRAELKLSRENAANIEHNRKLNQEERSQALRERDEARQERDHWYSQAKALFDRYDTAQPNQGGTTNANREN